MIRIAALSVAALLALAACGGGGDEQEPDVTTPAGDASTAGPSTSTPDGLTPEPTSSAAALPQIGTNCDLVTPKDVEEVLGEAVTGSSEFKDIACGYSTASGGLNIERGSQQDFEVGIFGTGELGEPVPGIGDQAAWFGFSEFGNDTLAVGKGDFYFQLRMNLPELDSATQLEMAKALAIKAVARIP